MGKKPRSDPLVCITLPLSQDADPWLLDICLQSLASQTYRKFEVLVFVSEASPPELMRTVASFPFAVLYEGSLTKSAARNFLGEKARGEYMMYIDVDMELSPRVLEECVTAASDLGAAAVVCPQKEAPTKSFVGMCRALEWELISRDLAGGNPYFVRSSTFEDVGGFDESLDLLDDWGFTLALEAEGIRLHRVASPILIRDTTNVREAFMRKYRRGRYVPGLVEKFPEVPQLHFTRRFLSAYIKNWRLLIRSPIHTLGLAFLKCIDISALTLGRLRPIRDATSDGARAYFRPGVASTYDKVRLGDGYNQYKHFSEVQALTALMPERGHVLLEVGCGTGRITRELTRRGYRIIPLDPSPAMLREFTTKPTLPGPVRADALALPFDGSLFAGVFSLRVIWHLSAPGQAERMLDECARVSAGFIVIDVTNERRWRHPLVRPIAALYHRVRPVQLSAHRTSRLFALNELEQLAMQRGLRLERVRPLDVMSPIWLRVMPSAIARTLFRILARLELIMSSLIPPGRFLIRLTKSSAP